MMSGKASHPLDLVEDFLELGRPVLWLNMFLLCLIHPPVFEGWFIPALR